MNHDLKAKVALVTGASRGIGKAISLALASEGATVVLTARNEAKLREVAEVITTKGHGSARVFPCDVSDKRAVGELVSKIIEELGRIDILVNNAASTYVASVIMSNEERWREQFEVNVFGTYYCTKEVLRPMIQARSGRIINISSVAARMGVAYSSSYSATKASVIGFTASVARETARLGITVNSICPWHVDTELLHDAMANRAKMFGKTPEAYLQAIVDDSPQHRLITAEEVAALTVFLASPLANGITGQAINICGGAAIG